MLNFLRYIFYIVVRDFGDVVDVAMVFPHYVGVHRVYRINNTLVSSYVSRLPESLAAFTRRI